MIRRILAVIKTWYMRRQIRKNLRIDRTYSVLKYAAQNDMVSPTSIGDPAAFPGMAEHLQKCERNIKAFAKERNASVQVPIYVTVGFGDSLMAFFAGSSRVIEDRLNFGLPGAMFMHILYVMQKLHPVMLACGLRVKNVVWGCGGNGLLAHQDYSAWKNDGAQVFAGARAIFCGARMIVYGLPPVYDVYAMLFQEEARKFFLNLVQADHSSVYLNILRKMAGSWGLLPTCEDSLEGIHMTPDAKVDFEEMIQKGLFAQEGSEI